MFVSNEFIDLCCAANPKYSDLIKRIISIFQGLQTSAGSTQALIDHCINLISAKKVNSCFTSLFLSFLSEQSDDVIALNITDINELFHFSTVDMTDIEVDIPPKLITAYSEYVCRIATEETLKAEQAARAEFVESKVALIQLQIDAILCDSDISSLSRRDQRELERLETRISNLRYGSNYTGD